MSHFNVFPPSDVAAGLSDCCPLPRPGRRRALLLSPPFKWGRGRRHYDHQASWLRDVGRARTVTSSVRQASQSAFLRLSLGCLAPTKEVDSR
eukprot:472708-Hanusia_phi.AAC.1